MTPSATVYNAFVPMLDYPTDTIGRDIERTGEALGDRCSDAETLWGEFAEYSAERTIGELQEEFTRTFDLSPKTTLDIGWHLYGEDYARGTFLVKMRQLMRRFEIAESIELPDHLSHILQILACMDHQEATPFVTDTVLRALDKMIDQDTLETQSPYMNVIRTLRILLRAEFAAGEGDKQ